MSNNKLSEIVSSYLTNNNTNPRKLAKEIGKQLGVPNAINYNTIYFWSKGLTKNPYKAALALPLLREHGDEKLSALADAILKELETTQPVQG